MKATCTKCNFSDEIPDSFLGKTVRCPQCATEIKLIDKANLTFELVEEPSETLPQKTQPACDTNVNIQAQPKESVEHNISTLCTADGYLELTTRHLRGEFKANINENGHRTTIKTSVDTLLSGVVGFQVMTRAKTAARVCFGTATLLCLIIASGCPEKELQICLVLVALLAALIAICLVPSYEFSLIVMGKEYGIHIEGDQVPQAEKFIKLLKDAKEQFERGV